MTIKPIWTLHTNFSTVGYFFLIQDMWFLLIRHTEKASSLLFFLTTLFEKCKSCKETQQQPGQVRLEKLVLGISMNSNIFALVFIYKISQYYLVI